MNKKFFTEKSRITVLSLIAFLIVVITFVCPVPAHAAHYYEEQTNFTDTTVPVTKYNWDKDTVESCIYKENTVPNSYYVWTKLAVQEWRQALREYTDNQKAWNITAHYVRSKSDLESCDVKIYIYDTFKEFPGYPTQTGAYTRVDYKHNDVRVYLAPIVLHGDGRTEIDLPHYAFRNSAVHEMGHVLGLGHMKSLTGYLMSPGFDFWKEKDQIPITTLELGALVKVYGTDGFD